eukprot:Unigene2623_Nuclearia_a/m.8108 Unigene2623_Nuclearia_a/g.8108  ORF Unigene2623_Nuclearia_a/g.8108 Unigene2623_Nuclearia_a/m.8108 type:complete len:297 (+) Unigene2623_Nuclearia_a:42-932(+)
MSRSVFVTGATGSIGFSVVEAFVAAGYKVSGLARSDESAAKLRAKGVEPVRADLTDYKAVVAAAQQADVTVHAGLVTDFAVFAKVDREISLELINGLAGKKLLYTSGVWIYGDHGEQVVDEDDAAPVEKSFPFGQNHRCTLEQELLAAAKANKVDLFIIRPANVVAKGVGFNKDLVNLSKAYGTSAIKISGPGENYISVVHVNDVGPAYRAVLEKGEPNGVYNLAAASVRLKEYAKGAAGELGGGDLPVESVVPDEASKHIGFSGVSLTLSLRATSKHMGALGWAPTKTTVAQLWL